MYWDNIAPMVVAVVLILTTGGVVLLRPLSKRLSELLELYTRDKAGGQIAEIRRMREVVETLEARLRLVEERQDFTDRLLEGPPERSSPEGRGIKAEAERLPPANDGA